MKWQKRVLQWAAIDSLYPAGRAHLRNTRAKRRKSRAGHLSRIMALSETAMIQILP